MLVALPALAATSIRPLAVQTERFQTVALIGKPGDPEASEAVARLAASLASRDLLVLVEADTAASLNRHNEHRVADLARIEREAELALVVGGDGTLLGAARALCEADIPLVGINLGRLGFLTETSLANIETSLDPLLNGQYQLEERMMLTVRVQRPDGRVEEGRAFNDLVIHRGSIARMIEMETYVDDQFVFSQRSDGLIVASPTGSTAYALSAGGPIVHPSMRAFTLVPICPHTLTNRPIVLPGNSRVEVVLATSPGEVQLTLDGQIQFALAAGDRIHVERDRHNVFLLSDPGRNYFDVLREKFSWGERT